MSKVDGSVPDGSQPQALYEAQGELAFISKWDGSQAEVSPEEAAEAGTGFGELIEGTLVSFADHTTGSMMTYLALERQLDDDSSVMAVITTKNPQFVEMGFPRLSLRLIEKDPLGVSHEIYDYKLANDGSAVRREDVGDQSARDISGDTPKARQYRATPELGQVAINDGAKNFELEEQMGINNQPVSSEEVQKLVELLSACRPVERTTES